MRKVLTLLSLLAALAMPAAAQDRPVLVLEIAGESNGTVEILLGPDKAPKHVERLVTLARQGAYDGVVFHRVIDGFMAQTGDVQHGRRGGDLSRAGTGGSNLPDLPAEFSQLPFGRGTLGMARSQSPNSANSQFFITFERASHLNGQYTVVGRVVKGMEVIDRIKRGTGPNGAVRGEPDYIKSARVK